MTVMCGRAEGVVATCSGERGMVRQGEMRLNHEPQPILCYRLLRSHYDQSVVL